MLLLLAVIRQWLREERDKIVVPVFNLLAQCQVESYSEDVQLDKQNFSTVLFC